MQQQKHRQHGKGLRGWFRARNGEVLTSRLIRAEDAELLIDFARRLSPETRRRRFHQNVEKLSDRMIRERARLLADVDNQTQGGAVLALAEERDGSSHIVGVARLGRSSNNPDDSAADAAIVVRDDYQGAGIGTELMQRLVLLAQKMKVEQVRAHVEVDNTPAMRLFRKLGLPAKISTSYGETTLVVEMPA